MGIVSVRLNDRDNTLIRKYAELHGLELSAFFRQAALEKIEDEHDLALFNKVWSEEINEERFSHEQLKNELGL